MFEKVGGRKRSNSGGTPRLEAAPGLDGVEGGVSSTTRNSASMGASGPSGVTVVLEGGTVVPEVGKASLAGTQCLHGQPAPTRDASTGTISGYVLLRQSLLRNLRGRHRARRRSRW